MNLTDGRMQRTKLVGRATVTTDYELKQIYERLRKRSYRRHYKWERWSLGADEYYYHKGYVAGARDALEEIRRS